MVQEAGVAIIVIGAVAFLVRRFFFSGGRKPKKATTFVPLTKLKKKPDDHCH